MFSATAFSAAGFGATDGAGASFTIAPTSRHVVGTYSITATGNGTSWGVSNPFSVQSGNGSISNYSNVSGTSATFDLTMNAVSATPIVIADSDSGTTRNFYPSDVPDAPTIGTATDNHDGTVSVTFSAPADNGGLAISSYTVTGSLGDSGSGASSPASVTIAAANKGQAQTFTVTATNARGTGSASSASNSVTPTTAPGAPTGVTAWTYNGKVVVDGTAPTDTGGLSITGYTATLSSGQTASGSLPLTVTAVQGVSVTATLKATNSYGTGSDSSASSAVTVGAGCASFDGSGGTYFTRTALVATATYPFWVSAWVRLYRSPVFATAYCVWASERAAGNNGTDLIIHNQVAKAQISDGVSFSSAADDEAIIPNPYWEHILCEFRSATDHRLWVNGEQKAQNTTSRAIDLSAGSPVTRIGIRGGGIQPFNGDVANVVVGTGTPTASDRTTLGTVGADYSTVAPTSGAVTSWYPLTANGTDVIGGLTMTASGSVSYSTDAVAERSSPTRVQAIDYVHHQSTLLSASPTVQTGKTSPISTVGWTNLADVEFLNISFTGNCGAWTTRVYHYVPTTSLNHVVFVDMGHGFIADWDAYELDTLIRDLVADGYGVAVTQLPGAGPTDPDYTGSGLISTIHDGYWSSYTANANPMERWLGPSAIAMNNLASRYTTRSIAGLSGGGCRAAHTFALDTRFNHACVAVRGTIADRRFLGVRDFEQWPLANGWKAEEFYKLCAAGTVANRRLWFIHHESDNCCFAKNVDATDGAPGGAYLDATTYDTEFLAPIRASYQYADVQFFEDQGAAGHAFNAWSIAKIIEALETALTDIPASNERSRAMFVRANRRRTVRVPGVYA